VIQKVSINPSKQFLLAIKKCGIIYPQKLDTNIPFFDQHTKSRFMTTSLVATTGCL
jgi:hypothetical protein